MIILDKPYVSDFLINTIRKNNYPVLQNEFATGLELDGGALFWTQEHAVKALAAQPDALIYAPSENSIQWMADNLAFTSLPDTIDAFKDKSRFRQLVSPLFPDFYFRDISLVELEDLEVESIPTPFIIKPAVGFFSMGVYKVDDKSEWPATIDKIKNEIAAIHDLYPRAVLDADRFIIEEIVGGSEFAFDAYFNRAGEPVLLNIFEHVFASDNDVSDRVYVTSKAITETYMQRFTHFLRDVASLKEMRNFPVHVEVRVGEDGVIRPIEINPMRFGGWCTTADMTMHAYKFNPYDYFFQQKSPNWETILADKNALYSIVVLDNSTGVESGKIQSFDYEKLLTKFEKPLELRRINYREYPVFGFLFVETRVDNFSELEYILQSNLREFITY